MQRWNNLDLLNGDRKVISVLLTAREVFWVTWDTRQKFTQHNMGTSQRFVLHLKVLELEFISSGGARCSENYW